MCFISVEPGFGPAFVGRAGPGPALFPDYDLGVADVGLPRCSYINTDFRGDDVGDGRGLTTGSPYECKRACIDEERCRFWTFRRGWERDCYLKRGDGRGTSGGSQKTLAINYKTLSRPGDLRPNNVIRRPGFVSGTVGSRCRCLRDGGDEVCPTRRNGGVGFPWRRFAAGPRFDYDDNDRFDYDYDDVEDSREIATR